jgi:hypothetical protein
MHWLIESLLVGTYSHWNGYKFDIGLNSCIDNYIKKSFSYQGLRSDGSPLYKSAAGNLYAKEGMYLCSIAYATKQTC